MPKHQFLIDRFSVSIDLLCEQSNLTNAELAELAGIGSSTLYSIKNGSKVPSMAEFVHLCNLFNLNPSKFFREDK